VQSNFKKVIYCTLAVIALSVTLQYVASTVLFLIGAVLIVVAFYWGWQLMKLFNYLQRKMNETNKEKKGV